MVNLDKPSDFGDAVDILLRPACRRFLIQLKKRSNENPIFLHYYEQSIGLKVQRVLYRNGIRWPPEIMFLYWARALYVALKRIDEQESKVGAKQDRRAGNAVRQTNAG